MPRSGNAHYKPVQGLRRGLAVLDALNRIPGGWASGPELARITGLHRTTVRRLLETLRLDGYVRRSDSDDSFRLTLKVRELSEGFRDDEWISAVAAPILAELLPKVVWPSDLTTLDGDSMVIRETTHRFSRLSFHRSMVRRRMPLLFTASGRAYLAFCPAAERTALLRLLASGNDDQARYAQDRRWLGELLARTRRQGYAANDGDWLEEDKIGALALPIPHGEEVAGCVNVVYLKRALTVEQAVEKVLPALSEAVQRIAEGLAERAQAPELDLAEPTESTSS